MLTADILEHSPAFKTYVAKMDQSISQVLQKAESLPRIFHFKDEMELRRSLALEAAALGCHWLQEFSAATPELLMWAKVFSKHLIQRSETSAAFSVISYPVKSESFFSNRLQYYRHNGAGWKLNEELLSSFIGVINFTCLMRGLKTPPLLGDQQNAEFLAEPNDSDTDSLEASLGIRIRSSDHFDSIGLWLKEYTEFLAALAAESSRDLISSIIESKEELKRSSRVMHFFTAASLTLGLWLLLLPWFEEIQKPWILVSTRIVVMIATGFAAIISPPLRCAIALSILILYNPVLPIKFDRLSSEAVGVFACLFFMVFGLRPRTGEFKK